MADIPLRPKEFDSKSIRKADADCLTYAAIFGCKNEDAFARFHPEYLDGAGRLNESGRKACRQFFIYAKNKQYLDDYRATLDDFCKRKGCKTEDKTTDIPENRKDRALKKLIADCLGAIEDNASLDPETLKDFVAMAKALGVLKDEEEQVESPRRYIPVRCRQECAYRFFVEKHLETGEIVSDCEFCKALAVAKEHGYHYDPTTNLSIPEELTKQNNNEKENEV